MRQPRAKKSSPLKTYAHLTEARRVPSEYELVTSKLLWYPERGFEVDTPVSRWYESHQRNGRLRGAAWDDFVDPRQTTYAAYCMLQRRQEAFVDGVLETIETSEYDRSLPAEWLALLDRVWPVLRYPFHAMQMLASYVGHMAPGGRIVITAALQAADEVRRIQRVAYRMVLLGHTHEGFGRDSRTLWEKDAAWQPLREALERALVAYDWGESFAALNLCIKPLFDELVLVHFAAFAREGGDPLLFPIASSFWQDSLWQRDWTRALCRLALDARPENRAALNDWVSGWAPRARRAVESLDAAFTSGRFAEACARAHGDYLASVGVEAR